MGAGGFAGRVTGRRSGRARRASARTSLGGFSSFLNSRNFLICSCCFYNFFIVLFWCVYMMKWRVYCRKENSMKLLLLSFGCKWKEELAGKGKNSLPMKGRIITNEKNHSIQPRPRLYYYFYIITKYVWAFVAYRIRPLLITLLQRKN